MSADNAHDNAHDMNSDLPINSESLPSSSPNSSQPPIINFWPFTDKNGNDGWGIAPLCPDLLPYFKDVMSSTMAVPYSNKFYNQLLEQDQWYGFLIVPDPRLWEDTDEEYRAGGAISVRAEKDKDSDRMVFYIMTMGVSKDCRRRGYGSQLLSHVYNLAALKELHIMRLHCPLDWKRSQSFYVSNGYVEIGVVPGYYKKLKWDAVILERIIQNMDWQDVGEGYIDFLLSNIRNMSFDRIKPVESEIVPPKQLNTSEETKTNANDSEMNTNSNGSPHANEIRPDSNTIDSTHANEILADSVISADRK